MTLAGAGASSGAGSGAGLGAGPGAIAGSMQTAGTQAPAAQAGAGGATFPTAGAGGAPALPMAGAGPGTAGQAPVPPPRPNILFIFTDDHAYQAISAYGSRINQTPHLDRIAHEGMRFDRALVTNSICGPMRATILTGKYSHLHGFMVNDNARFDGSQQTFPKLLQQAGYQTAVIGKWHLYSTPTGFDHYEVLIGQGEYYNPELTTVNGRRTYTGYTTAIIADLTLEWLRQQRNPNKPFMLMYQHKAPHRRWDPGPKHLTLYDGIDIPEPDTLFDDWSGRGTAAKTQDMTIAETMDERDLKLITPAILTPDQRRLWEAAYGPKNQAFRAANLSGPDLVRWKYQRYIKDYLRCVASLDDNVGRVLAYLDQSGLAASTIVVYASDQGFFLGEHGWFDKRWMYEQSFRTPMLIRWPGVVRAGSINADLVSTLDLPETFLEAAGVQVPGDMQGASLLPLLLGQTPAAWRKSFYYHYYEHPGWHYVRRHYGVANARYKLMHFYEPNLNEWEMYDLQMDPKEMRSVYNDPGYVQVRSELMAELGRLRAELKVPVQDPPGSVVSNPPPRVRPLP